MLRKSLAGVVLTIIAAVLAVSTAAAAGSATVGQGEPSHGAKGKGGPPCRVSNERTGLRSRSLQAGIDAAASGDTLVIKGTCVGSSTVTEDLTLRGRDHPAFGGATLDGDHLGSVLTIADGVTVSIDNLVITNGSGGGIVNGLGSTVVLSGSAVTRNTSAGDGGGISNPGDSSLTVENSTISGNAAGGLGGGIYSQNGSIVTLNNTTVSGNSSVFLGGGIFSYNGGGGSVTLNDSTVSGNTANGDGGGIFFYYETVTLNNSTVTGNTTPENGGGVYDFDGTFTLLGSSTVTANSAGLNGGGIFLQQVFDGTLINCISGVNVTANSPNDIFP